MRHNMSESDQNKVIQIYNLFKNQGYTDIKIAYELAKEIDGFKNSKNPVAKLHDTKKLKWFKHKLRESIIPKFYTEKKDVLESSIKADGTQSKDIILNTKVELDFNNPEKILTELGYDPKYFALVSSSIKKSEWDANTKENGISKLYSYRIQASVKPIDITKNEISFEHVKETLENIVNNRKIPEVKINKLKSNSEEKIAIVNIADIHFGKLAWAPETGENYDLKIATDRFNNIVDSSINRLMKEDNLTKIVFFWSQDFFHYDNPNQTTSSGITFQQTDMRWQKMFDEGVKLLIEAIDKLKQIAPVYTFYTRSNHDEQTAYYAKAVLSATFKNDKLVEVNDSPSPRKYIKFGINLLGFAHGDKEGKRLPNLMSIEAPEYWSSTKNREFFLGHFHSQIVKEEAGITLRYLSSPAGSDAWHNQMGFIGSKRGAQIFIRGYNSGPIAEYNINFFG